MKLIKYYRYRTGMVRGNIISFDRESMKSFEETLAKLANRPPDNHTCYLVELDCLLTEHKTVAFMFTDLRMHMGEIVEERNW